MKYLAGICDKKFNENSRQYILSLNVKSTQRFLELFKKFYQNWRNFSQKFRKKVNEINGIHSIFSKV